MYEISVFLLGLMIGSIPILMVLTLKNVKKSSALTVEINKAMNESMVELNKLHNKAIANYNLIETRLSKLETIIAARAYEKGASR